MNDDFFFDKEAEIFTTGGVKLPHWTQYEKYIFYTFRLYDSLPKEKILEFKQLRQKWVESHPQPWDETTKNEYNRVFCGVIEKWIDQGYGSCILRYPEVSRVVYDSLWHYDDIKYRLMAFVIMPNHVHVLISLMGNNTVSSIVQDWKSFTAHQINRVLNRKGDVWMPRYHDRIIRNKLHYVNVLNYIQFNYKQGGLIIGGHEFS